MAIKIYKVIQRAILAFVIGVILAFFTVTIFMDMNPYVVVSGSMQPAIPVGSIVLTDCQQRDAEVGDIISYKAGDAVITHRVVEKTDDGYVTKGDNNDSKDPGIVKESQVFGVCKIIIPKAGYVVSFLRTLRGVVITITGLICFSLLGSLLENMEKSKKREEKSDERNSN